MQQPSQHLQNIATVGNGCIISQCSSQMPKGQCQNLLTPSRKDLWISLGPPPQHFTLQLTHLSRRPSSINLFGLDCWHDYNTNPRVIELFVSSDGKKFTSVGRFKCQRAAGWQYFKFPEQQLPRFFRVQVVENWGGEKTYVNQVMLAEEGAGKGYREDEEEEADGIRDDNGLQRFLPQEHNKHNGATEQHLKLTSTQKELKKVSQRVGRLEQENQSLKQKVHEQDSTIHQLQAAMGMLIKNMQKMQKVIQGWNRLSQSPTPAAAAPNPHHHHPNPYPNYPDPTITDSIVSRAYHLQYNPPSASSSSHPKITESHSSRRQKSSTGYNKKPVNSVHSQKLKQSSSENSLHTENVRMDNVETGGYAESVEKKRKIATLLESLQHKITLRNKMKRKLQSPQRRNDSDSDQDYDFNS